MLQILKSRHGRLYKKLLLRSLLFILVPTLMFTAFFNFNVRETLENEINQANLSHLILYQKDIDKIMDETKKDALFLSLEPKIHELLLLQNDQHQNQYTYVETLLDIRTVLSSILVTDNFIHSIYLYNNKTGDIVTSSTSDGVSGHELTYYDTSWLDDINTIKGFKLLPVRKPINKEFINDHVTIDTDRDITSNVITLIYPIHLANSDIDATIAFNMYERSFDLYDGNDDLFIMNRAGQIIQKLL